MIEEFLSNPDWPSRLSAWSAVAGVIVAIIACMFSVIAIFRTKKNSPDYAIVSRDGTILSYRGLGEYGLQVKLRTEKSKPEYNLKFKKVPSYFEVTTMEGAVVQISQSDPLEFTLLFVGAGFGDPVIKCNFKIQVYT